jgi:uncharacterized cysteine cluster protein YcgN (CxxCxxCC family)
MWLRFTAYVMTPDEWEAICDGCGKCCGIRTTNYACPALNCKTNRCMSYDTRLTDFVCREVTPSTIAPLWEAGVLPDSCAYVRRAQKKPPLEVIEKAALTPVASAPLSVRRHVWKQIKAWRKKCQTKTTSVT